LTGEGEGGGEFILIFHPPLHPLLYEPVAIKGGEIMVNWKLKTGNCYNATIPWM